MIVETCIIVASIALGTYINLRLVNKKLDGVFCQALNNDMRLIDQGKQLEALNELVQVLVEAKRWTFCVVDMPSLDNFSKKHVNALHRMDPQRFGPWSEYQTALSDWSNRALSGSAVSPAMIAELRRLTIEDVEQDGDLEAEYSRQKSRVNKRVSNAQEHEDNS